MAAFREKVEVLAAMPDCLADQLFTALIALSRIDDIQPRIERAIQQFRDGLFGGFFVTDFRAPETEDRNLHVRLAELPSFHVGIVGRFRETPMANGIVLQDQSCRPCPTFDPADW